MTQPPDKRFVIESRVDSLVAKELRNPLSTTNFELKPMIAAEADVAATEALASNPTVADAAAQAVTDNIAGRSLVESSDTRIVRTLSASSIYSYVITDLDDNLLFAIMKDGTILEGPDLNSYEPFESIQIARSSGYAYVLTDSDNNIIYAIRLDATIEGKITTALNVPVAAFDPTLYHVVSEGTTGSRSIKVYTRLTGAVRTLTSGADDTDPVLKSDKIVLFKRAGAEMYVPFDGGTPHKTVAGPELTTWGDSLTAANGWQTRMKELTPALVISNEGIGSQTSEHIAMRQGGIAAPMTVTGGVIPASGGVEVVPGASIILMTTNYPARSTTGFLGGVHGTLSYPGVSGTPYTFTRDTAGTAINVTNPVNFYTDSQYTGEDRIVTLWTGRNNPNTTVEAHTEAMVNRLTSLVKKFLVFSTTKASSEVTGNATGARIDAINAWQQNKWGRWEDGGNFVNLQEYLRLNALSIMGLTPTAEDTTAINGGALPPQIMIYNATTQTYDSLHFSTDTQRLVIGPYIHQILTSKGWI